MSHTESTCQYAANAVRGKTHTSRQRALSDRLKRLEYSDGSETLDWLLLDQYFQNSGLEASHVDPSNEMSGLFMDDPGAFDPRA
ncbi:hypothetical protein PENCOP_c007G05878 [Penicillium coprophilum]|uniref:Uncharacterized protein n=1 Tax=Penicillium coprophilum TaxID=36646 RepID=A0A1V6ULL0_9EURO|nr:hypothetical protein PENCOP_c007G05878 [Penicillium coprophilum]